MATDAALGRTPRAMAGRDALMEQLVADGHRHLFGNPGTTELGFLDALHHHRALDYVVALNEPVAVGMADGYARATGRPAFVQLHVAAGLGNALGMLYNAAQARTPLVVYAGQASTRVRAQDPILGGDLVEMARPVCKWAVEATHADDLPRLLRRASKVAAESPPGPVLVSIPMNALEDEGTVVVAPTTHTRRPGAAAPDDLAALAAVLLAAERPVILVGDGLLPAAGDPAVTALAEHLAAPILGAGWASEPVVDAGHPLWIGAFNNDPVPAAREAYSGADVLLHLGAPADPPAFDARPHEQRPARVLQVDLDLAELSKNAPADVAVAADPARTAGALLALLREAPARPALAASREERRDAVVAEVAAEEARRLVVSDDARHQVPIAGPRLAEALAVALPDDAVVFDESLSIRPWVARRLARRPGSYFRARGSGIGVGMPGAVGVQLGLPDRPVVGLVADGSSLYSFPAVWTAAHHRVPVTWVIVNNRSYRTLKVNALAHLGSVEVAASIPGTELGDPPIAFDGLAAALGVASFRADEPDALEDVLEQALQVPGPSLVEVVIDGSFP